MIYFCMFFYLWYGQGDNNFINICCVIYFTNIVKNLGVFCEKSFNVSNVSKGY